MAGICALASLTVASISVGHYGYYEGRLLLSYKIRIQPDCFGGHMKLADIDVDELVKALHMERSTWIKAPKEQGRRETDAEKVTICVLAALEHVFANAGASSDPHLKPPSG